LASLAWPWTWRKREIPRDWYSREYYLSDACEGFGEFQRGDRISPLKERLVAKVAVGPGERVLELGCGRGEALRACAERGACAVGIDYSRDAVELTRSTCGDRAAVLQADATELPLRSGSFGKVFLGDVLEHLTSVQAERMLAEAYRVTGETGTVVIHTSPNVLFIRLVFPWVLLALALSGRIALLRLFLRQYRTIRRLHVREYSAARLRRLFRRLPFGRVEIECDRDVLRGGQSRYTEALARHPAIRAVAAIVAREPLVRLFSNDLWVVARKRG
jgi:ubiquinone/menaquinone biosynthesis C-methylase UbiE